MSGYAVRPARGAAAVGARPSRRWGPLRYRDQRLGCDVIKVLPGEYHATGEDVALMTVLGSCVAVCLHDPGARVGGMNHFMLPDAGPAGGDTGGRYGAHAMELLVNELLKAGARRESLRAKVFGGAAVLASLAGSRVGERNATFVRAYLTAERIPVAAADLEGVSPRKVLFYPASGRALVRHLAPVEAEPVVRHEHVYRSRLRETPVAGDVELF